jgi:hypothetical protein
MVGSPSPIGRVVALFGGQNAMARKLGRRQGTVWGWLNQGRVPSARIPEIIAAARDLDPPVALRPDDFFDISPAAPDKPEATEQEAA